MCTLILEKILNCSMICSICAKPCAFHPDSNFNARFPFDFKKIKKQQQALEQPLTVSSCPPTSSTAQRCRLIGRVAYFWVTPAVCLLVVSENLKAKSAPTVTCKHHLLRMPLNEQNHYSESIGVFPTESEPTTSERAKDNFVCSKLATPFMFAVLAAIQKQYSLMSKRAPPLCMAVFEKPLLHFVNQWQPLMPWTFPLFDEIPEWKWLIHSMITARLFNCTKWHLSTFTSTFSTSACKDVLHPSPLMRVSQQCQSEKEYAFIRHLEVAVASERQPLPFWRADAWRAELNVPSRLALLVKGKYWRLIYLHVVHEREVLRADVQVQPLVTTLVLARLIKGNGCGPTRFLQYPRWAFVQMLHAQV